ncbi:MAG: cytochrome o ubiquinol oxidase subunit III [Verrucomicrobia bacterium]|nr:cytochrome o ubiquinol oxidase subunit III [Verrucomicrobiota bacterium]
MSKSLAVHHERDPSADTRIPDPHQDIFSKRKLGFWMYLMTDTILFTVLFTTYAVLHENTFGGPSTQDLFSLKTSFIETMALLFSSVSCGFALLASLRSQKTQSLVWLAVTFLLGASFVAIELTEFTQFVREGHSWRKSAFLSSFFTLVGTHGLHVSIGLLWMAVMMVQVYVLGITMATFRRLVIFSLFWHFLDLIWIFIFTLVYLMGVT